LAWASLIEAGSLVEQIAVRSGAGEDNGAAPAHGVVELVDQQEVAADMTLAIARPIDFPRKIRDELKLNRPDAGWYQIRKALEANSDNELVELRPFNIAYANLGAKLRPSVFEMGFLLE
jgi:hypothetical protein